MSDSPSVQLYHPRGVKVFIPLGSGFIEAGPDILMKQVSAYLDAGFLVAAPGLEAGEETEKIGWCLKGEKSDGTAFVLLYVDHERMSHSILKVYMNDDACIADFEFASKLSLKGMPLYDGNDKLERGKDTRKDAKYLVRIGKPFGVVFKDNPKYEATAAEAARLKGEVYGVPKRMFVRWSDQRPRPEGTPAAASEPQRGQQIDGVPSDPIVRAWKERLAKDPPLAQFNAMVKEWQAITYTDDKGRDTKNAILEEIKATASKSNLVWLESKREYVFNGPF